MDFDLKTVTNRIKQTLTEPIMGPTRKRDGTKKDVSDSDTKMKRECLRTEAEKLIQESAQSTRKLGVNGSERKSRACTESHDSSQDEVFHEVRENLDPLHEKLEKQETIHNDQEQ